MQNQEKRTDTGDFSSNNLLTMPLQDLRREWSVAWNIEPHKNISRSLLIKSLLYKQREAEGRGLSHEQQTKLDQLVRAYKRSQADGSKRQMRLKAGTRLYRDWNGKRYTVTVGNGGFEYDGMSYKSLSAIASAITGTRWNGWVFFGIRNPESAGAK